MLEVLRLSRTGRGVLRKKGLDRHMWRGIVKMCEVLPGAQMVFTLRDIKVFEIKFETGWDDISSVREKIVKCRIGWESCVWFSRRADVGFYCCKRVR